MAKKVVWNKVVIDFRQLVHETAKAWLIELAEGEFAGYTFWVSNKLVKNNDDKYYEDLKDGTFALTFTDDFDFNIFKTVERENGMFEVDIEIKLSAEKLKDQFSK